MHIIARIRTDFPDKFGIPRQSGLVEQLQGKIVFEPEYRSADALRRLDEFSHIWLLWKFQGTERERWSATVRPPRLGGNERVGVFATRSPFRPNGIGLSCVRLERIEPETGEGPVIYVLGADLMDGTPIYDIKPYIPYTDCRPEASGGYTDRTAEHRLSVDFPPELLELLPPDRRAAAVKILEQDPRPMYQNDPERVHGLKFAGFDLRFCVDGDRLSVCQAVPLEK